MMKTKFIPHSRGLTLPEVMIAATVVIISLVALLYSYTKCLELQDIGRNVSLATQAVKNRMEGIKNTAFSSLLGLNGTTFTASGINGRGIIYTSNPIAGNANVVQIKIAFCFRQPNGRVIGEDTNLNGVLNAGEDRNANGQIDSYVQITTNLYN